MKNLKNVKQLSKSEQQLISGGFRPLANQSCTSDSDCPEGYGCGLYYEYVDKPNTYICMLNKIQ